MTSTPVKLWYSKAVVRAMPYAASLPDLVVGRPTLIGHTNGGGADLYDWFRRPGNDICSHFQIFADGRVEQYVPLNKQAYAQYDGNAFAWSAEHQDDGNNTTPLTAAQLTAFADIAHELGVPRTLSPVNGPGIGWHSLYPAQWNRSGHDCPGHVREAQFRSLLAAPAPAPRPTPSDPLLRVGSTGQRVIDVQHALDKLGNKTAHTDGLGKFGPETYRVLCVFQKHRKLPVTGTTTPATWAALRAVAHPAKGS